MTGLNFEYTVRAMQMLGLPETMAKQLHEQRDQELEDHLSDVAARIAALEARVTALEP